MYSSSRIISTPISNNRLNFDERGNRTIVVPNLIEGTLDDVTMGEEIVIEGEVNGKMTSGKGLKHFIFLKNSRVPTWIMDNHNHAFAFWHESFWKGWIQKGSLLIHIDQHTDLGTPLEMPMKNEEGRMKNGKSDYFNSLKEIEEYTNTDLTIADFIVPALATGLISEAVMVTGENRNGAGVFVWENDRLIKKYNPVIARTTLGGRGYPRNGLLRTSQGQGHISLILDIDLDYFSQGFDDAKTLETTKYWIEKADIITIATSPLFIEQDKALAVLKSLQSSLVAL